MRLRNQSIDVNGSMRIINVLPKFAEDYWAGAEEAVASTAPHLQSLGFQIEVLTTAWGADSGCDTVRGLQVKRFPAFYPPAVHSGWSTRRRAAAGVGSISPPLLRELWSIPPGDAVVHLHAHNKLATTASWVCARRGIPFAYTMHSLLMRESRRMFKGRSWSFEWGLQAAGHVFAVSIEDLQTLRTFRAGPSSLLPNGVEPDVWSAGDPFRFRSKFAIDKGRDVWLQVGRICDVKNQAHSLAIARWLETQRAVPPV